jgi:hypothetical protein
MINFDPDAGSYPIFVKNNANNLVGFKLDIKNNAMAGVGNQIAASTSNNYAVDVYFAQADLAVTPGATKTTAFAAVLTSGDLKFGLAVGATTSPMQVFTVTATLPTGNCKLYTWLCACVKAGPGAQYVDSITTNNCQCKDASAKISCSPGKKSGEKDTYAL